MLSGNADPEPNTYKGRENLQLKIAGVVLMVIASPAFYFLQSPTRPFSTAELSNLKRQEDVLKACAELEKIICGGVHPETASELAEIRPRMIEILRREGEEAGGALKR